MYPNGKTTFSLLVPSSLSARSHSKQRRPGVPPPPRPPRSPPHQASSKLHPPRVPPPVPGFVLALEGLMVLRPLYLGFTILPTGREPERYVRPWTGTRARNFPVPAEATSVTTLDHVGAGDVTSARAPCFPCATSCERAARAAALLTPPPSWPLSLRPAWSPRPFRCLATAKLPLPSGRLGTGHARPRAPSGFTPTSLVNGTSLSSIIS